MLTTIILSLIHMLQTVVSNLGQAKATTADASQTLFRTGLRTWRLRLVCNHMKTRYKMPLCGGLQMVYKHCFHLNVNSLLVPFFAFLFFSSCFEDGLYNGEHSTTSTCP